MPENSYPWIICGSCGERGYIHDYAGHVCSACYCGGARGDCVAPELADERDEARQIARWLLAWTRADTHSGWAEEDDAWDAMPQWLQDAIMEG